MPPTTFVQRFYVLNLYSIFSKEKGDKSDIHEGKQNTGGHLDEKTKIVLCKISLDAGVIAVDFRL